MLVLAALSIFPLLGLLLLGFGARNVWRGVASVSWPKVSGVVLEPGDAENSSVIVAYKVDGREYKTETMHFGESVGSSDPSEAEMARLRYPKGMEFPVAYHPQNPALAAIKPGFAAEALTLPVIGLALVLAGVMFVFAYQSSTIQGPGMSKMVPRMFAAIFMLIGLMLMVPGVRRMVRGRESLSWPKAPGVILFSTGTSITSVERNDDRDSESYGKTTSSTTFNSPLVVEYEVNGRKHYSNTRRFGHLSGSSDAKWAEEIAERYPTGAKVHVAYSPADPDLSVLEPGNNSEAYFLPGAGAAFFLFGLLVILVVRF